MLRPFAALLLTYLLTACLPTSQVRQADQTTQLKASFGPQGVIWLISDQACVARSPSFRPSCPMLPPVKDVAWNGSEAWGALPSRGLVVTLDGPARSLSAGKVALLSGTRAYREDGTAWSYDNKAAAGVLGRPQQVQTGGDGQDYALLGGHLQRVDDGAMLGYQAERAGAQSVLFAISNGVQLANLPTAASGEWRYQLRAGQLEQLSLTGQVNKSIWVGQQAQSIGIVRDNVVVLGIATEALVNANEVWQRRYSFELIELN